MKVICLPSSKTLCRNDRNYPHVSTFLVSHIATTRGNIPLFALTSIIVVTFPILTPKMAAIHAYVRRATIKKIISSYVKWHNLWNNVLPSLLKLWHITLHNDPLLCFNIMVWYWNRFSYLFARSLPMCCSANFLTLYNIIMWTLVPWSSFRYSLQMDYLYLEFWLYLLNNPWYKKNCCPTISKAYMCSCQLPNNKPPIVNKMTNSCHPWKTFSNTFCFKSLLGYCRSSQYPNPLLIITSFKTPPKWATLSKTALTFSFVVYQQMLHSMCI